jgi:hypothetical protein
MVELGCPTQVGKFGLQTSQAVSNEERVGWVVRVEPTDAAEEIKARSHGVRGTAYGSWAAVAYTLVSPGL